MVIVTRRVVRYEDFSEAPYNKTKILFKFLGFEMHADVKHFLDTHTKGSTVKNQWSTYRDTKSTPYHWRQEYTFEEVDAIQNACGQAMKLWGYTMAVNETHQLNFDPILPEFEFSSDLKNL